MRHFNRPAIVVADDGWPQPALDELPAVALVAVVAAEPVAETGHSTRPPRFAVPVSPSTVPAAQPVA